MLRQTPFELERSKASAVGQRLVYVTGASFRGADLLTLESLASACRSLDTISARLGALAQEFVPLVTCNRAELYWVATDADQNPTALLALLAELSGIPVDVLSKQTHTHRHIGAAHHLFVVACGLDSLVQGDEQIASQVREAADAARRAGIAGPVLDRLFRDALSLARVARSRCGPLRPDASIGTLAAEVALSLLPETPRQVLVIGAGRVAESAAKALAAKGTSPVLVTNRTYESACKLAQRIDGRAIRFEALESAVTDADVVISATAAPHLVLRAATVEAARRARDGRQLLLIDIAMPRDVDPACRDLPSTTLIDLEQLGQYDRRASASSQIGVDRVQAMVEAKAAEFIRWLAGADATPTVVALRDWAEQVRKSSFADAMAKLPELSEHERLVIDRLTRSIVSKLLHEPTVALKTDDPEWSYAERSRLVCHLFGLANEPSLQEEHR